MLTMSVTPNITIVSNDEKLTYRWNENPLKIVHLNWNAEVGVPPSLT